MTEEVKDSEKEQVSLGIFWCWVRRLAIGVVAIVLLLVLAGVAYQAIASARDAQRYPPPGRLIDVGGYRLHINSTGEGTPTVVLDAGVCDCSLNWCLVQPEIAKFTRVCSYDRAGMGWSDADPSPRTSEVIVRELHTLLANAGIHGPYVLVGHSFGGYNVRLFAHEYSEEVAGLVLVDSAHEDQWPRLPESVKSLYAWWTQDMRKGRLLSPFGINRLFYVWPNPKLPAELQPIDRALRSRTRYLSTMYNEWINIEKDSAAQVRAAASLPQVPMMVLTAEKHGDEPPPGVSEEDFTQWNALLYEMQADLASRCTGSVHITVPNSTHVIQLDQPAAVVEAIRKAVSAAREHSLLRAKEQ
jgi:pimeloyl-ACP methyl ester carboxylesterase